ncbi:hypothetical protein F4778DRAFT_725582 [Xylariomycetidae sp. FL2044]|nr:hypothetical protein F4778DRAFT_725582 [Xylariomycetidae sp. FL2044]
MAAAIENRGPQLLAVDYLFLIVVVITVVLRCGVRIFMVKKFASDDWLMLLACCFFVIYCTCSMNGVYFGTGRHKADLTEANNAQAKEYWWFCYLSYSMSMLFSKMSIAWFLLRVAAQRLHRWIIWAALTITTVTCMTFFFVTIFQCHPVSYFWDTYTQEGTCINSTVVIALGYIYSSCAVITDFTFALLPAWIIFQLKMKARTKLALVPLMAMGCVASSAVVVRFAYLPTLADPDFLWATTDIAIWSTVEQGLAIAAGSLATLRPLFKIIGYKMGLTTRPSGGHTTDYGKMGTSGKHGNHFGHSRRQGSQSAVDAMKLDTFGVPSTQKDSIERIGAYEVTCKSESRGKRKTPLPGEIFTGRTYEITEQYIEPEVRSDNVPDRRSKSTRKSTYKWGTRGGDSESVEELQMK